MPRAGLDYSVVVECAAGIVDRQGAEGLSFAEVAKDLGVKAPSLYKHVDGVAALRRGVAIAAKQELLAALRAAVTGLAGERAVWALAVAYRNWAKQNPHRYPLTVRAPLVDDVVDQEVSGDLVALAMASLRQFELGSEERVHAVRYLRAVLHGFVALEIAGAFALPTDLDESYREAVTGALGSINETA